MQDERCTKSAIQVGRIGVLCEWDALALPSWDDSVYKMWPADAVVCRVELCCCELWTPVQKTDAKAALDAGLNSMQELAVSAVSQRTANSEQSKIRNRPKTKQIKSKNWGKQNTKQNNHKLKAKKKGKQENRKTGRGTRWRPMRWATSSYVCHGCRAGVGGVACLARYSVSTWCTWLEVGDC